MNVGSLDRVHQDLYGVGGGRPLRRERAVHDGAHLGVEVSGAHHFRDGLVYLLSERGGYLALNSVLGNRRRSADGDRGAAASHEPACGRCYRDDGRRNVPFPFKHAIPKAAARLRGCGHLRSLSSVPGALCRAGPPVGLGLTPIVPAAHCPPVELRLRGLLTRR